MEKNPHLLHEAPISWRLDPQTRELGRRGVARARAILADAARRQEAATPAAGDAVATTGATGRHSPASSPARQHRSAA